MQATQKARSDGEEQEEDDSEKCGQGELRVGVVLDVPSDAEENGTRECAQQQS